MMIKISTIERTGVSTLVLMVLDFWFFLLLDFNSKVEKEIAIQNEYKFFFLLWHMMKFLYVV